MKNLVIALTLMASAHAASAADFPVTVESCGTPITFSAPPKRAIINDLNMAEMAFALHLQDRIVGLTGISGWYKMTPDFRQAMGTIPELAPKYPSLETLLAAEPDFFFAGWNYGMKVGGEVTPATLAKYGVKTFVLSESCVFTAAHKKKATMDLLYGDVLTLGRIFGKRNEAQTLVEGWKQRLSALPKPATGARPLKVFVYDSGEDKPFTSGRYAMPTAIIEAAGGKNAMEALDISWGTTSWENVAASEPDVIILLDYQTGSGADALRRVLENHPLMKMTPAVKQGRYLKLQYAELTPGPANIAAVEKLARTLYPQARK
ncbi:ABC transporter substrate-binding protein [Enterobacter cancerogenus]|jgi:iron complex transport system substrate-binding protein|uniref:ABC transporter substrate-binding protein n=1 Tax=Enterobacter cancerogenus TaxID=69218 RepID=A0ABX8KKB4_9ENTR|nr:ABC transporter substrate-binding protein [Enterobacter cancerogenus]KTQ46670.1 ABC transporter substrate-binding protein [Enterobacter cancerogenus]KTQ47623.1 ABC transporter substrate-binding protein [Enterobacter cancerogenus]KTQ71672.1 ABC transporter substrate-binding protein [Enterobacter cancerogenus]KTQ76934.1 ABC transporter substrate-binding protein [Enterobacter cancerogenus]MDT7008388.1 ABC transporter substrate-binding protein [Enterobacter cancerogenus]